MFIRTATATIPALILSVSAIFHPAFSGGRDPDVRLVITGNLEGAVRDCRCPHGQPGGLARRKTIFDRIRSESPAPLLMLDCGGLTKGLGRAEMELLVRLYRSLDYTVICPYRDDEETLMEHVPGSEVFPRSRGPFSSFFSTERGNQVTLFGTSFVKIKLPSNLNVTVTSVTTSKRGGGPDGSSGGEEVPTEAGIDPPGESSLWVLLRNLAPGEEEMPVREVALAGVKVERGSSGRELPDVVVIGGGGFVDSEVRRVDDMLVAYPGYYGGWVLVLDLWVGDGGRVENFSWQAVPTETAPPDSLFKALADSVYGEVNQGK